jgi:predicted  nucleic acid-binding Zn-ribbon protein
MNLKLKDGVYTITFKVDERHKIYDMIRARQRKIENIDSEIRQAENAVIAARKKLQELKDARDTGKLYSEITALEGFAKKWESEGQPDNSAKE